MLSKEDITEIYEKYVAVNYTGEYTRKYVPFSTALNDKTWKWENKDFSRIIALLEFREYMLEYDKVFDSVLSFSSIDIWGGKDPEYEYLKYKEYFNYNYEDDIKYDLHSVDLEKKDFDFAMINWVIEHLYDPRLALRTIYNHMRIGGMFYVIAPSNCIPHCTPFHFYTGFTPVGLGAVLRLAVLYMLK